jgi:predicted PurR-regulated permease PerM
MSKPDKLQILLPESKLENRLNEWRAMIILAGSMVPFLIAVAIAFAFPTFRLWLSDWREPSELTAGLLITSIFVAGGGVSLAVFELIRYLIRKRRVATSVLLKPPQDEIEFWKEADRQYEEAKARLLERQKDRGEDS